MLKTRMRKLTTLCYAIDLLAVCSISAFASTSSWSVTLPRFSQQVDLRSGTHVTNADYIEGSVTSMGGSYDDVYMSARAHLAGSWLDVSSSEDVYKGEGFKTISFNEDVPARTSMMLVGGNSDWTYVNVVASGKVNFH